MQIQKELRKLLLEAQYQNQQQLDAILDKIAQSGMQSLTPEEKAFLRDPDGEQDEVLDSQDLFGGQEDSLEDIFDTLDSWEEEGILDSDDYEDGNSNILQQAQDWLVEKHGRVLKRKVGSQSHRILLLNSQGQHIMSLDTYVRQLLRGGEEESYVLYVDNRLMGEFFLTFDGVSRDTQKEILNDYIYDMFGYEVEEVRLVSIQKYV